MRLALTALLLALCAGSAQGACRQALALGLDVSGSVDAREYRLQTEGLANALSSEAVRAALLAMPEADVALAVFEWSGQGAQRLLLDWTVITDAAVLDEVTQRLRGVARADMDLSTALGEAKGFGAELLARGPVCWRQVLDLSGDGTSNGGPHPQSLRPPGITINGLVIGQPETPGHGTIGIGELTAYFRAYVIQGPDAFIETALGFDGFQQAMTRKLLRELQVMVIGARQ